MEFPSWPGEVPPTAALSPLGNTVAASAAAWAQLPAT